MRKAEIKLLKRKKEVSAFLQFENRLIQTNPNFIIANKIGVAQASCGRNSEDYQLEKIS